MLTKIVISMAILRILSSFIEFLAAILIYRSNSIEKALLINSLLALVGPLIFISITTIGLIGIADKLSFQKLIWIIVGIACLFIGVLKK
jgi:hypothetical protein